MAKSNPDKKASTAKQVSLHFARLIGNDPSFKRALVIAQRVAGSDLPVLIFGESGTGKEILVRSIHQASERCKQSLVDVNCAAIPDSLSK